MHHAINHTVGYPPPPGHQTWGTPCYWHQVLITGEALLQLLTSGDHHWRPVQTCSLEAPHPSHWYWHLVVATEAGGRHSTEMLLLFDVFSRCELFLIPLIIVYWRFVWKPFSRQFLLKNPQISYPSSGVILEVSVQFEPLVSWCIGCIGFFRRLVGEWVESPWASWIRQWFIIASKIHAQNKTNDGAWRMPKLK